MGKLNLITKMYNKYAVPTATYVYLEVYLG
jgi:hypothetical protein